jgi:hypothetical protein
MEKQRGRKRIGFFTLVPLVSPHYSLLSLVFLLTQFYPTLVPFAQKCAWTSSPPTLTLLTGRTHYKLSLNVTYRAGPLQTFTLSCACAASSSSIPTPTLPLSFAWHILGGAAACFFTGAASSFFDDAEACGGLPSGRIRGRTDLRRLADLRRAAYRLWTDLRCLVPWYILGVAACFFTGAAT